MVEITRVADSLPLSDATVQLFRATLAQSISVGTSLWSNADDFQSSIKHAFGREWKRGSDPSFPAAQHKRFGAVIQSGAGKHTGAETPKGGEGLPGAEDADGAETLTPEDFSPRLLSGGRSGAPYSAIAEMRFKGLDPNQPFVEFPLSHFEEPTQLRDLVEAALSAFTSLGPRRVRISLAPEMRDAVKNTPGLRIEADLYTVAARVRDLRKSDLPKSVFELRPVQDIESCYARYLGLHERFAERNPGVAKEVLLQNVEDFSEMIEKGKSFDAYHSGDWAGFIAATPEGFWGLPGWVMYEEFLDGPFLGKRLGSALQRALLAELEGDDSILWGTIHATNQPSLGTALRHGRRIVQVHDWISLSQAG